MNPFFMWNHKESRLFKIYWKLVPKRIILETIIRDLSSYVDINKFIDTLDRRKEEYSM